MLHVDDTRLPSATVAMHKYMYVHLVISVTEVYWRTAIAYC